MARKTQWNQGARAAALGLVLMSAGVGPVSCQVADAVGPSVSADAEGASPISIAATDAGERMAIGIRDTRLVAQITGSGTPNATAERWDVYGTDLGHMFWHRDRLYMVFGDTFGRGGRRWGRHWRSNVLARLAPPDLRRDVLRMESMVTGEDGFARELLPSRKVDGVEKTVIPTNGVSTGRRMFLHYMSVQKWHGAGRWDVGHSGLAYSDDDGETWIQPESAVWPTGSGFEQVAFVRQDDWVYSFGIPGGRHGGVRLRRVASEQMLEPGAYQYWDGAGWVSAAEEAATLVSGPVGELSVAWNAHYRQWMMMYLDPARHAVLLRFAAELTGPWSDGEVVVSAEDQPGLYAPYIVPLREVGREVWFTMSKWKPYNVFLMRMTLGDLPVRADKPEE